VLARPPLLGRWQLHEFEKFAPQLPERLADFGGGNAKKLSAEIDQVQPSVREALVKRVLER
jgi:hypothetical protein